MGKVIAIVNQKGGVGKTTTAINVGLYLARAGKKVLLIDMDPQANATIGLGFDNQDVERGIYELLIDEATHDEVIRPTNHDGYHILPATTSLAGATVELVPLMDREYLLRKVIDKIRDQYDYILIDCPPTLGVLTVNSLVAADELLIPVQSEYFSLNGLRQLQETIKLVQENLHKDLKVMGVVLTMFDQRYRLSTRVLEDLYEHFPDRIFRSSIPRNIRLAEAPERGKTIFEHDPRSPGAKAYRNLVKEILTGESS
ncbi:MAG: AAA family ATPase [Patescibacteria group bacterium]